MAVLGPVVEEARGAVRAAMDQARRYRVVGRVRRPLVVAKQVELESTEVHGPCRELLYGHLLQARSAAHRRVAPAGRGSPASLASPSGAPGEPRALDGRRTSRPRP